MLHWWKPSCLKQTLQHQTRLWLRAWLRVERPRRQEMCQLNFGSCAAENKKPFSERPKCAKDHELLRASNRRAAMVRRSPDVPRVYAYHCSLPRSSALLLSPCLSVQGASGSKGSGNFKPETCEPATVYKMNKKDVDMLGSVRGAEGRLACAIAAALAQPQGQHLFVPPSHPPPPHPPYFSSYSSNCASLLSYNFCPDYYLGNVRKGF